MTQEIKKPAQAVILAGGRGTRLKPITNNIPKPMIEFHGRPFLFYLIDLLKQQGFKRVLLLLGYLPDVIIDYFGDGRSVGIDIDYDVSDVDNETGARLKHALPKLEEHFLLMYCDNYWPMNFDDMWNCFLKNNAPVQITVYENADKYTKDNLNVENSLVVNYDKARKQEGLKGVDIGFVIMRKDVIDMIPDENVNFEKIIYPRLVEKQSLAAYVNGHRYYSVGDFDRLKLTEDFLKFPQAVILDRDGVLNKRPAKGCYVRTWPEFEWLNGRMEAIRLLKDSGYYVIIITNQAGIARGVMTENELIYIHKKMKEDLNKNNTDVDAIYYCPHGWHDGCECRKPKPGMLYQAQRDFSLDLTRTIFIGDDIRDKEAGDAAGCKTIILSEDKSLLEIVQGILSGRDGL